MLSDLARQVTAFVGAHAAWAPAIVALLAFCESLAVVSFFVPATIILVAVGGIIAPAGLSFWTLWLAASCGAIAGDWLSYVVGRLFADRVTGSGFYARHRATAERAVAFVQRWGAWGIFLGRFSGPLRAFVPLVAGVLAIPQVPFQIANITSALIWAGAILSPGTLIGGWLH